jgi:hypothetical protein
MSSVIDALISIVSSREGKFTKCLVLKKVDTFLMLTLTQIYILFLILNLLYEFKFALPMKAEESNAEEQLSRK